MPLSLARPAGVGGARRSLREACGKPARPRLTGQAGRGAVQVAALLFLNNRHRLWGEVSYTSVFIVSVPTSPLKIAAPGAGRHASSRPEPGRSVGQCDGLGQGREPLYVHRCHHLNVTTVTLTCSGARFSLFKDITIVF